MIGVLRSGTSAAEAVAKHDVARLHLPGGASEGPCMLSVRMHGKRGHVLVVNVTLRCFRVQQDFQEPRQVTHFALIPGKRTLKDDADVEVQPEFTLGLDEITELRKMGGFGWKGKMVVGWALGREVVDGLEIVDREGNHHVLTAIKGRDELFNRLIAMGNQNGSVGELATFSLVLHIHVFDPGIQVVVRHLTARHLSVIDAGRCQCGPPEIDAPTTPDGLSSTRAAW